MYVEGLLLFIKDRQSQAFSHCENLLKSNKYKYLGYHKQCSVHSGDVQELNTSRSLLTSKTHQPDELMAENLSTPTEEREAFKNGPLNTLIQDITITLIFLDSIQFFKKEQTINKSYLS